MCMRCCRKRSDPDDPEDMDIDTIDMYHRDLVVGQEQRFNAQPSQMGRMVNSAAAAPTMGQAYAYPLVSAQESAG
jgi:hypothetical protein